MFVSHWTRARLGCPVWIPGDRKRLWGGKCETAFKPCLNCSSQTVIVCTNIHSLWLLYQCHKIKSIFTWTQIPHSHWFQIFMKLDPMPGLYLFSLHFTAPYLICYKILTRAFVHMFQMRKIPASFYTSSSCLWWSSHLCISTPLCPTEFVLNALCSFRSLYP